MLDLGNGRGPFRTSTMSATSTRCCSAAADKDHIGGLSLLPKIGNPPIFATEITAKKLPAGTKVQSLPLNGRGDVLGIPVDTGRNGHAPGGIWMRFHAGTGLLYTGDYSTESALYAFDMFPKSRTVLFDNSYGDDDTPLAERLKILSPHLADDVLLPAPPTAASRTSRCIFTAPAKRSALTMRPAQP